MASELKSLADNSEHYGDRIGTSVEGAFARLEEANALIEEVVSQDKDAAMEAKAEFDDMLGTVADFEKRVEGKVARLLR